jgi:hypothetical protein
MLVSIDIVFYGPQFLIPYIMIVEAPLYAGDRSPWRGCLLNVLIYVAVPNLLSMISMFETALPMYIPRIRGRP